MACSCGQHRNEAGCRGADFLRSQPREFRQRNGREGGRAQSFLAREKVLDRYRHLDRDDAIVQAWRDALHTRKLRWYRAKRKAATS